MASLTAPRGDDEDPWGEHVDWDPSRTKSQGLEEEA